MHKNRPSRAIVVTSLLAVMLLVCAMVGGSVWHDHNGASDATCQICHMSHQTAAPDLAANQNWAPVVIGITPLPTDSSRISVPSLLLNISRAPPAA